MKAKLKQIVPWVLYDFANAPFAAIVLTFVFSTFFTKYIAAEELEGTTLWATTLALSGIIIGVVSPILGAIADQTGRKKPWILFFATTVIISCYALSYVEGGPQWQNYSIVIVLIANCCYTFAQVFYNSLLITVAPTHMIGRISGIGWGLGYFGGLCCLIITFVFFIPNEDHLLLLTNGVKNSLKLVAIWFLAFSLPLFILLDENQKRKISWKAVNSGLQQLYATFCSIKQFKTLLGFLAAYFFYSDGVATLLNFGGIFAATVLHFTFNEVLIFAISINLVAGIGAIIFGLVDDKIGPSKLINLSLVVILGCCVMILAIQKALIFWIFGLLLGVFIGPLQSASRSMLAQIVPKENVAEMFGLYALTGRFSTFIGPLFISILTFFFKSKTAGLFVVVLMLSLGFILILKFFDHPFRKRFLFFWKK